MRDNNDIKQKVQKHSRRTIKKTGQKNPRACAEALRMQREIDKHGVGIKTLNSWKNQTPLVFNNNNQKKIANNNKRIDVEIFKGGSNYRKPPNWRNLLDKEKSYWLYKSIKDEKLATFTLKLSDKVIDQTLNISSCAPFLLKRIQRAIKKECSYKNQNILIAAECFSKKSELKKLHIHGVISIPEVEDLNSLRKALKNAGGKDYNKGKTHEGNQLNLNTSPFDVGNWVAYYCSKQLHNTDRVVTGKVIACTKQMKTRGREIYNQDRSEMIKTIKNKRSPRVRR